MLRYFTLKGNVPMAEYHRQAALARAAKLSPEQRTQIASKAARTRWQLSDNLRALKLAQELLERLEGVQPYSRQLLALIEDLKNSANSVTPSA